MLRFAILFVAVAMWSGATQADVLQPNPDGTSDDGSLRLLPELQAALCRRAATCEARVAIECDRAKYREESRFVRSCANPCRSEREEAAAKEKIGCARK